MHIYGIDIKNFRNHQERKIVLNKGINLIIGKNACGKTSLLESIFFVSTWRSHRNAEMKDLINEREESFLVVCDYYDRKNRRYEVAVDRNGNRALKIDDQRQKRIIPSKLSVVMFSPDDSQIIKGERNKRRNYIDNIIYQGENSYRSLIIHYNKVIKQRNALLKSISIGEEKFNTLEPWTEKMIQNGSQIVEKRKSFIRDFNILLKEKSAMVFKNSKTVELKYLDSSNKAENIDVFRDEINRIQGEEIRKRQSLIGPHRDEILIMINNKDSRQYASQGEQRLIIICLKYAEVDYINKHLNTDPVLLLDDVLSELDEAHQSKVLELVENVDQSILTATFEPEIKTDLNLIRL